MSSKTNGSGACFNLCIHKIFEIIFVYALETASFAIQVSNPNSFFKMTTSFLSNCLSFHKKPFTE